MDYEDTITLNAFLTAATRLEQPLPADLQRQLNEIAEQFPDSVYELHEIAERYEPLKREYVAALQDLPSEGQRLKFAESQPLEPSFQEGMVSWEEVERQLGTYFKDIALDLIERSHPDYECMIAEALQAALTELKQNLTINIDDVDEWLDEVFDDTNDGL